MWPWSMSDSVDRQSAAAAAASSPKDLRDSRAGSKSTAGSSIGRSLSSSISRKSTLSPSSPGRRSIASSAKRDAKTSKMSRASVYPAGKLLSLMTPSEKSPSPSDKRKNQFTFPQTDKPMPPLSSKDFVFIFVEIIMVYSSHLIRKRKSEAHAYQSQLGKTRREIEIELLFVQGWAAFGSLLAGVLADGYIGTFYVALSSIIIIFVMASFLFAEQILILRLNRNPYADVFTSVSTVVHLLNHSTGIYRVVFGLENLRNKKPYAASLLLFIFTFTGDAPCSGGILMVIAKGARLSTFDLVRISWWSSMLSVVLFMAFFKSIDQEKSRRLTSRRILRCACNWIWHIFTHRFTKTPWTYRMLSQYDRSTLNRAKGLIHYAFLLLPIAGYIFYITGKTENLYYRLLQLEKPTGLSYYLGSMASWAFSVLLTMILTYFALIPILSCLGIPKKFNYHFPLGYFFALCALYYAALVLKVTEKYNYDGEIGYVRIFNARDRNSTLIALDSTAANAKLTVPSHGAVMGAYVISGVQLIPTMVKFDETTNFTTFMKAEPKKCYCYAIVDPPELIRVMKEVPLFEGPPLTNDNAKPRIYLFNGERGNPKKTVQYKDLATGKLVLTLAPILGETYIFQLPPGNYEVEVDGTDLHLVKQLNDGGLYGILLLAGLTGSLLELDEVIPGKDLSSQIFAMFAIFYGMSLTFAYVPLRTMTYTKAPTGLLNTTFGILSAQEYVAVWIMVVGYNTWHELILGNALLTYSIGLTFLFFLSIFIMTKYNRIYD